MIKYDESSKRIEPGLPSPASYASPYRLPIPFLNHTYEAGEPVRVTFVPSPAEVVAKLTLKNWSAGLVLIVEASIVIPERPGTTLKSVLAKVPMVVEPVRDSPLTPVPANEA